MNKKRDLDVAKALGIDELPSYMFGKCELCEAEDIFKFEFVGNKVACENCFSDWWVKENNLPEDYFSEKD